VDGEQQNESDQHSEVRTSDKTKGQRGRMPLACAFTTPATPTHFSFGFFGFSFSSSLPSASPFRFLSRLLSLLPLP
jgi:hypothetical protein